LLLPKFNIWKPVVDEQVAMDTRLVVGHSDRYIREMGPTPSHFVGPNLGCIVRALGEDIQLKAHSAKKADKFEALCTWWQFAPKTR